MVHLSDSKISNTPESVQEDNFESKIVLAPKISQNCPVRRTPKNKIVLIDENSGVQKRLMRQFQSKIMAGFLSFTWFPACTASKTSTVILSTSSIRSSSWSLIPGLILNRVGVTKVPLVFLRGRFSSAKQLSQDLIKVKIWFGFENQFEPMSSRHGWF